MSSSGRTVEEILDGGAVGLLYFEKYLPILHRLGASAYTFADLRARYDEQRGLDLDVLESAGRLLGDGIIAARTELDRQGALAKTLADAWVGSVAEAAIADIRSDWTLAHQRVQSTDQLAQALEQAGVDIRGALERKADEIGQFEPTGRGASDRGLVDGKSLAVVMNIDAVACIDPANSMTAVHGMSLIDAVASSLPSVVAPVPMPGAPVPSLFPTGSVSLSLEDRLVHAQRVCDEWLRNVFAPIVSAACRNLVDTCRSIDDAVRSYLTTVAIVAESIETGRFPTIGASGGDAAAGSVLAAPGSAADAVEHRSGTNSGGASSAPASSAPTSSGTGPVPTESIVAGSATGAQGPNTENPHLGPADVRPALEAIFGGLPSCTDVIDAIEQAGHELTERMKSAIDEAVDRLASAGDSLATAGGVPVQPDDPTPRGEAEPKTAEAKENPAPQISSAPSLPPPLVTPLPQVDGSAERGHLEAALDGHSARISLAHNGTVALDLGTPDGDNRRFELRSGPFGLPIVEQTVVSAHPEPPAHVESQTHLAVDAAPAPVPSPTAEGTEVPSEQPIPEPAPPPAMEPPTVIEQHPVIEPPPAAEQHRGSGAQLTEAGPL